MTSLMASGVCCSTSILTVCGVNVIMVKTVPKNAWSTSCLSSGEVQYLQALHWYKADTSLNDEKRRLKEL